MLTLEVLVAELIERRGILTAEETKLLAALDAVNAAEAGAKASFERFYASLAIGSTDSALPPDVAAAMAHWVEARKHWETLSAALLKTHTARPKAPVRRGPRMGIKPPESVRMPSALPAKDALAALFAPHLWKTDAAQLGLVADVSAATQVRVEFDDALGFGPEQAVRQITKNGPAAAQTFLALASLWKETLGDQPSETYLSVYASDLLRFQGKKETPKGGYHREDLLAKGRDVYLLSRISLPRATVRDTSADGAVKTVKTVAIGRLLSLETLEAVTIEEAGVVTQSVVRFRFHLSSEAHHWISEHQTEVAPKLLSYHPVRQKYQILLGFCLAWADATIGSGSEERRIPLPLLLKLAAVPIPERRIAEFFSSIEDAIHELAKDAIVPGVRLVKPPRWTELLAERRTRALIDQSEVVFPRLLARLAPKESPLEH
jgi:hypothetical protein